MSVKTEYKCDVCRSEKPPQALFGVRFSGMQSFKLDDPIGHAGVHICVGCANQIAKQYPTTAAGQLAEGKPEVQK